MTRNIASAIAIAAAIVPCSVFADDITIDTTPFASTMSRAEVQAELMRRTAVNEWTRQLNQQAQFRSSYGREQARAAYVAERDNVKALTGEDSGSAYLAMAPYVNARSVMGGPAR